ncbi:MAG: hypothetical protein IGS48_15185 [Oscillatoriales cyanobacterium C42_A2020_001]|nr:hypothetical protein [Leptolyngbyaceae cyanobacterium C42_A2020_001]
MGWDDSPWQKVVSAALIGTERQPFTVPAAMGKLGQLLPHLSGQATEPALLLTAATISLHQRAGWQPRLYPVSSQDVCDRSDFPLCSARAARLLHQMLQGQYAEVLPEWLAIATQKGQRVPGFYLPDLLDLGKQRRDLRIAILPVLGQRGRWLAAQNLDWSYAIEVATEQDWETGHSIARSLYLQNLRSHNPDHAREVLQTTWNQESASDRAKFLATLRTRLSMADEPFLEATLLGDRSKEVCRVAVDLLASLPNSRLCQQVTEHTCRYLSVERNKTPLLQVQLPDRLDDTLVALGIEPKPSPSMDSKLGEKAWWLLQMIGATPLSVWIDQGQITPKQILELTTSHEWQSVLLDGFALAAKRQNNPIWLEAIFELWLIKQASIRDAALVDLSTEDLFNSLPPEHRDALLVKALQHSPDKITDSLVIWLLRYNAHPWNLDLSRAVLESLEHHFRQTNALTNLDWELRTALKEFARFVSISILSEIPTLQSSITTGSAWAQSMEDFLDLLRFRQEIIQAFETKNEN